MKKAPLIFWVVVICLAFAAWSAFGPADWLTWFFELILGAAGIGLMVWTYRRFRFSNLSYVLACIHFVILAVGAKYTYSEVPLFDWLRDWWGLSRNHFDRVGHFAQGFVPAIIIRELLIRVVKVRPGVVLGVLCIGLCLGFSALYELIEWGVVIIFFPDEGPEWLGHQGDVWDAQWDMFLAIIGATLAILTLSRLHNRSMERIPPRVD